jgi:hypothetical protein
MIKSRRMRWEICVDHTGGVINTLKILAEKSGKLQEHLVDLGVDVRIIFKLVLDVFGVRK